ncbi:MAG: hypothetical protein PF518_04620 [Spirochaetaceae bacterium]|jgi:hypothetical protein|nr:hypothetical protein [Spirochaetaceae bacterium]
MRRRRPVGRKIYTIHYLLDKQPKSISRDKLYNLMIGHYRDSPALKNLLFNKRCYSLLNDAVINPEHLNNFYKTYKLPINPFFPLFFMIKRNYLIDKENRKSAKHVYIQTRMSNLHPYILKYMTLVHDLEKNHNRALNTPIYNHYIFPKTKKQVDLYSRYKHRDWILFFRNFFELLIKNYQRLTADKIDLLTACFILACIPGGYSDLPDLSQVKKHYRSFSKKYHPDTGGDADLFVELKWAYDLLSDQ